MRRAQYEEERWEKPEATGVWLTVAFFFLTCAVGAAVAALGLADEVQVQPSELWIAAAGCAGLAAMGFLAHVDVNKGRRPRVLVIKRGPTRQD